MNCEQYPETFNPQKVVKYPKKLFYLFSLLTFIAIFFFQNPSIVDAQSGNTYYVSPNGNDNSAGNQNNPFQTIQEGIDRATAGDTIYVRGGTYRETVNLTRSGTASSPIRLLAYPNEQPVIDGTYDLPSGPAANCSNVAPGHCFVYSPLVFIRASHIEFSGFKVTRSRGRGITVAANPTDSNTRTRDVLIDSCIVDGTRNAAINIQDSSNVTVQHCDVSHGANYATHPRSAKVLNWPVIVNIIRADNVRVRKSVLHESWGEGIAAGRDSQNVTIEDNIIYDNHAMQIYIHRAQDVLVQRNLIYHTNNQDFWRGGHPSQCIVLNNEAHFTTSLSTKNVLIKNNVIAGCKRNISVWGSQNSGISIENVEIMNNTLVNAKSNNGTDGLGIGVLSSAVVKNVNVHHNIIHQPSETNASIPSNDEIRFWNNGWDRNPPSTASGNDDYVGDLQLTNPGATLAAGAVNINWFKPGYASPASQRGLGPYEYYNESDPSASEPPDEIPAPTEPSGAPTDAPIVGTPECSNSSISLVFNSGFDENGSKWKHHNSGQGSYSLVHGDYRGETAGEVKVLSPGDNMQLYQSGIELEKGQTYRLSFYAYSNSGRDMDVIVHQHNSPYKSVGIDTTADLSTDWQYYSYDFKPHISDEDIRLRFWLTEHAQAGDTYYFDQVVIAKVDDTCAVGDNERTDIQIENEPLNPALFLPLIQ